MASSPVGDDPIPIPPVGPPAPPCDCPEFCEGQPSGTMAFCEDGVWTALAPPAVNSRLEYNAATNQPYWQPIAGKKKAKPKKPR